MKITVEFLIEKDDIPTVFAYFPDSNWDDKGAYKTCYAHIGQHSACSTTYAEECVTALSEEYKELKRELEDWGYDLDIVNER